MYDPCENCCVPDDLIRNCAECQDCSYNEMLWKVMLEEVEAEKRDLLSLDDDFGAFL